MDQEQDNKTFYKMADSFIDVANAHCDNEQTSTVGSSLLFATARFSSFVVASHAEDKEAYLAEIDNATEFFSKEFKRMLVENLEEYKSVFKEAPKYEHLMNKEEKE